MKVHSQIIAVNDTTYILEYKISKETTTNPYLISFLNKLANVTQVKDPYFYIDLATTLYTTKVGMDKYQVNCVVDKKQIRGNYLWNGFDLSPSLFPSQYNVLVEITKNGKATPHPVGAVLFNNQTLLSTFAIDSASTPPLAKLKGITIEFDKQWENEIMQQIAAIETYQKSDSLFSRWQDISQKIELQKTELIPLYDFEMDDLTREIKAVTELNIVHLLKLNEKDPKQFAPKLTNINIAVSQKQMILNEYLMNIDQRFILDARKHKELGNILQSIQSYNKALEYHAFNVSALLELSRLYYEIGNLQEASLLTKRVLTTTYPDEKQNDEITYAANKLYRKIVNQGNDMLVAQRFAEAQSIFEKANIFCDSTQNESFCNGEHIRGIIAAKTGIYQSYISVVRKALQSNFTEIAENYIKEVQKYQQANKKEIPSDAELQRCVDDLVNQLLGSSTRQLQTRQYIKALVSLEKADSVGHLFRPDFKLANLTDYRKRAAQGGFDELIAQTNKYAFQFDQFMAKKTYQKTTGFVNKYRIYIQDTSALKSTLRNIMNIEYLNSVNIGNQLCREQLCQSALNQYLYAKELEQTYQIPQSINLDSLIRKLSKPLTLDYLSKCRQNIWGNDFDKASDFFAKADSMIKNAHLFNDSTVREEIAKTEMLLKNQRCTYQNIRYHDFVETYRQAISENQFTLASSMIDSLNCISTTYAQCVNEVAITSEEQGRIRQISTYQQWIKDARYLIAINQISQALTTFYKADSMYKTTIKWMDKIYSDSLSGLFVLVNNQKILLEACSWLYYNEKPAEAFTMLSFMKQKGFNAKETKTLQKKIAKSLAKTDQMKNPSINKKVLIKKYAAKGAWYSYFRSSYLGNPINIFLR